MDTNNNPGPGESNVPTGGSNGSDEVAGFSEEGNASLGESNVPTSPGESSAAPGESNVPT